MGEGCDKVVGAAPGAGVAAAGAGVVGAGATVGAGACP